MITLTLHPAIEVRLEAESYDNTRIYYEEILQEVKAKLEKYFESGDGEEITGDAPFFIRIKRVIVHDINDN